MIGQFSQEPLVKKVWDIQGLHLTDFPLYWQTSIEISFDWHFIDLRLVI